MDIDIKVLGSGCDRCRSTYQLIDEVARAKGVPISLHQAQDFSDLIHYGVMSTPGIVINGRLVLAGAVPSRARIEAWLETDG